MASKTGKRAVVSIETFIFEIERFEPEYWFSVNNVPHRAGAWWEHAEINLTARCVFPAKLEKRLLQVSLVGDRALSAQGEPSSSWRPRGVGELHLPGQGGRFYASLPQDSLPFVTGSLTAGQFRFLLLEGPPLFRSRSLAQSFRFAQTVDLSEF